MAPIIRRFELRDLDRIYEIETSSFNEPYSKYLFYFYHFISPDTFLVIEENWVVIGYIIGIIKKKSEGHIVSIAVDPSYRNKGYGTKLMLELIKRFKSNDVKIIKLEVDSRNSIAKKFYEHFGFTSIGIIKKYYRYSDAIVMMLRL
jgi:ribosomal-protein-alanine N-acetyltransferase